MSCSIHRHCSAPTKIKRVLLFLPLNGLLLLAYALLALFSLVKIKSLHNSCKVHAHRQQCHQRSRKKNDKVNSRIIEFISCPVQSKKVLSWFVIFCMLHSALISLKKKAITVFSIA